MIDVHYWPTPNGHKITIFLEEAKLPYKLIPVEIRAGDQFKPSFLAIAPNNRIPAIVDQTPADGGEPISLFESGAILLYLAEKSGQFLPAKTDQGRGELLSWLMFVATGIGPFSGQAVHFRHFAPEPVPYANQRYQYEAKRHYKILDDRLAKQPYLVGGAYGIVDMALWGWARMIPFIMGEEAWAEFPNVKRLHDEIGARPAAQRANALREKHAFKTEFDEEARRHMFKHIA